MDRPRPPRRARIVRRGVAALAVLAGGALIAFGLVPSGGPRARDGGPVDAGAPIAPGDATVLAAGAPARDVLGEARRAAERAADAARREAARPRQTLRCLTYPTERPLARLRLHAMGRTVETDADGRVAADAQTLRLFAPVDEDVAVLALDRPRAGDDAGDGAGEAVLWCAPSRVVRGLVRLEPAPTGAVAISTAAFLCGDETPPPRAGEPPRVGSAAWLTARLSDRPTDATVADDDGAFALRVPTVDGALVRVDADGYETAYVGVPASDAGALHVTLRGSLHVRGQVRAADDATLVEGWGVLVYAVRRSAAPDRVGRFAAGLEGASIRAGDAARAVIQRARAGRTDLEGRFDITVPPADAASVVLYGTSVRVDVGPLDRDRHVVLSLPARRDGDVEARYRLLDQGRPAFPAGEWSWDATVDETIDDVRIESPLWVANDPAALVFGAPLAAGRTFTLHLVRRVGDGSAPFGRIAQRIDKRWTTGDARELDLATLPDAPPSDDPER